MTPSTLSERCQKVTLFVHCLNICPFTDGRSGCALFLSFFYWLLFLPWLALSSSNNEFIVGLLSFPYMAFVVSLEEAFCLILFYDVFFCHCDEIFIFGWACLGSGYPFVGALTVISAYLIV